MLHIEGLIADVASLGRPWLYLLVLALAFGETAVLADLVVPGEVGMILAGAAAALQPDVEPVWMIASGVAGATLGDTVGYVIGRVWGWDAICRYRWSRRLLGPKAASARRYFERRGGAAVFFGRFVGALRAVVAVVAGMGHMPYGRFLLWNVLASLGWVTAAILLGYELGPHVTGTVDTVSSIVAVAVVAAVVVLGALRWWQARHEPPVRIPECVARGRGLDDAHRPEPAVTVPAGRRPRPHARRRAGAVPLRLRTPCWRPWRSHALHRYDIVRQPGVVAGRIRTALDLAASVPGRPSGGAGPRM